jgi:LysM repeat protein
MKRIMAALILLVVTAVGTAMHPAAAQTNQITYTVQPGDNLFRIGLKFNVRADILAQANGIVNPNLVYVGQKLIVPVSAASLTLTPADGNATAVATMSASESASEPATLVATLAATSAATTVDEGTLVATSAATATVSVDTATTYTVQPGDTLYRIAVKFNTTTFVMAQLNNIQNPSLIYVGQVLRIPGRAPVPPTATPTNTAVPTTPSPAVTIQVVTNTAVPASATTEGLTATMAATSSAEVAAGPTIPTIAVPTISYVIVTNTPGNTVVPPTLTPIGGTPTNMASNVGFAYGLIVGSSSKIDPATTATSVTDLGVNWVKLSIYWKDYEPTKGAIDFTSLDTVVNPLTGTGAKLLLTVSRAPGWARTTNAEDGPATSNTDFGNFIGAVAAHYKGKVAAYEIWNNPNIRREWNGKPLSAASYVELVRVAFAAIKNADPSALVLSAGLAPTGFNDNVNAIADRAYLQQSLSAGLTAYIDAIGVHANGWANPPDSSCCVASPGVSGWYNDRTFYFKDTLDDYRKILTQNNADGKFVWVTEFGWGAAAGVANDPSIVNQNFGYVKFLSQQQQAQYDLRGFEIGKGLGYVGPMFLSNLNFCQIVPTDPASSAFEPCYNGLLDPSGAQRPAYAALKGASKQ